MSATVQELNQHFIDRWWDGDAGLPDLGPLYTAHARTQNEKGLLQFLGQVDRMLSKPPRSRGKPRPHKRTSARRSGLWLRRLSVSRARNWISSRHRLFRMCQRHLCGWRVTLILI